MTEQNYKEEAQKLKKVTGKRLIDVQVDKTVIGWCYVLTFEHGIVLEISTETGMDNVVFDFL